MSHLQVRLRGAGGQKRFDLDGQSIHVELRPRPIVLVGVGVLHMIRLWGTGLFPCRFGPKHKEDASAGTRKLERFRVRPDYGSFRIPVLGSSFIRDQLENPVYVLLLRSVARNPDDVGPQVRIVVLLEQLLLNFGGPPKTSASCRGDQHEDADFPDILVERAPQRLGVLIESDVVSRNRRLEGGWKLSPVLSDVSRS